MSICKKKIIQRNHGYFFSYILPKGISCQTIIQRYNQYNDSHDMQYFHEHKVSKCALLQPLQAPPKLTQSATTAIRKPSSLELMMIATESMILMSV